jgi:hypothetical protein
MERKSTAWAEVLRGWEMRCGLRGHPAWSGKAPEQSNECELGQLSPRSPRLPLDLSVTDTATSIGERWLVTARVSCGAGSGLGRLEHAPADCLTGSPQPITRSASASLMSGGLG